MECYKPVWLGLKEGNRSVPCGVCYACLLNWASSWAQRMMHEKEMHEKSVFATLTYDDAHLPEAYTERKARKGCRPRSFRAGSLVVAHAQQFLKNLRKKVKVRFYLAGEYGDDTKRPHYHAVLFGVGKDAKPLIEKAWGKGFVHCGDVTDDSCNYVAGYVTKKVGNRGRIVEKDGKCPEFALMSRKPGIGGKFVDEYSEEMLERGYNVVKGNKVALPRYYVGRLYPKGSDQHVTREFVAERMRAEAVADRRERIRQVGMTAVIKEDVDRRKALLENAKARQTFRRSRV